MEALAARADLDDIPHALFTGRAIILGASSAEEGFVSCAYTHSGRTLPVSIRTGRSLSGSSTPTIM
jgi:hypothetical protein